MVAGPGNTQRVISRLRPSDLDPLVPGIHSLINCFDEFTIGGCDIDPQSNIHPCFGAPSVWAGEEARPASLTRWSKTAPSKAALAMLFRLVDAIISGTWENCGSFPAQSLGRTHSLSATAQVLIATSGQLTQLPLNIRCLPPRRPPPTPRRLTDPSEVGGEKDEYLHMDPADAHMGESHGSW